VCPSGRLPSSATFLIIFLFLLPRDIKQTCLEI
jgi:hypothetical protein